MKEKCEVVKDLLPNYIEDQVSNITKTYIEKHIIECKECRDIYNSFARQRNRKNSR